MKVDLYKTRLCPLSGVWGSARNLLFLDTLEDGGDALLRNIGIITNRREMMSQNIIIFKTNVVKK